MITATRTGILLFSLAVISGPLYTVEKYSFISNLISELGAQHTPNNFIMIIAFVLLGGGIVIDGVRKFRVALLPFIFFGLAMAIVGLFPHKPIDTSLAFNSTYHNLHGIIASVAGTVITIGFIWQGFLSKGSQRIVGLYMAGVSIIFPILILTFPAYQGLIQRGMYIQVLAWVWIKYPEKMANKSLHKDCQH